MIRIYEFPNLVNDAFRGVPGMIADSLPDKFGNAVIRQWLASQGKTEENFNVISWIYRRDKIARAKIKS